MTNYWDCTQKGKDMDKKRKPQKKNLISSNSGTKQCHKDKLFQSKSKQIDKYFDHAREQKTVENVGGDDFNCG